MRARLVTVLLVSGAALVACGRTVPIPAASPKAGTIPAASSCVLVRPAPAKPADQPLPASLRKASFAPVTNADASVAYLMDTYGLSKEEADQRLNLQRESDLLNRWLVARYPDQLGEMRLDPAVGTIVLPTTDPDTLSADPELATYAHRSAVVIERAAWSARTVKAIGDCIRGRLADHDPVVELSVRFDLAAGQIWIEAADTDLGREFLNAPAVADEVRAAAGVIDTRTHPVLEPK